MKCEKCKQEIEKEGIKIKNRYTNEIVFESKTAKTIKEAIEEAVKKEANLREADLREADLREANLWKADLWKADLSEANLNKANLCFCKMNKKVFKQIVEEWFEWEINEDS